MSTPPSIQSDWKDDIADFIESQGWQNAPLTDRSVGIMLERIESLLVDRKAHMIERVSAYSLELQSSNNLSETEKGIIAWALENAASRLQKPAKPEEH